MSTPNSGSDTGTNPDLWQSWKITGGHYSQPDPEAFDSLINNVPHEDTKELAIKTALYALMNVGRLRLPEEYCQPLIDLKPDTNDTERYEILDQFIADTGLISQVLEEMDSAYEQSAAYTFDERRRVPYNVKASHDALPARRVIEAMNKSYDPAFEMVGPKLSKMSELILYILTAKQKGIDPIEVEASIE